MTEQPLLSNADFTAALAALPLVSIDVCVTDSRDRLLLAKRNNAPAKDWWFTPGARIRKNEAIKQALVRVLHDELGLPMTMAQRASLMGAWDHFYPDSAFDAHTSTHYVNLPHALRLTQEEADAVHPPQGGDEQHAHWQWLALDSAAQDPTVHAYVQTYARWLFRQR
jgi:colanic acid biosynthesis protein WcaH